MALVFYLATEDKGTNYRLTADKPHPDAMPYDVSGSLEKIAITFRDIERNSSNGEVVLRHGISKDSWPKGYSAPSPDQKARFDSYRRSLSLSSR